MFRKSMLSAIAALLFVFPVFASKEIRVYADIAGDLLHMGHVEFFKKAKEIGDYLIIGVLSDEDIASYKRVPILTLEERVEMVAACRYVDEVIIAPPLRLTPEWILEHQIDYVVHGDDFNPDLLKDQYGASLDLGIFRSVPYTRGISTTQILQRIADRLSNEAEHCGS